MGKCVVKDCKSRSQTANKSTGVTFHKVPKDEQLRKKWIEAIRLLRKETDWLPTNATIICSKHFHDEDKLDPKSGSGHVFLSNQAVPVLVNGSCSEEQVEISVEDDELNTDEEIDGVNDTPKEHKMRQTIYRLRHVNENRLRKIKSLSQRNKRLEIRNKILKAVIAELKAKKKDEKRRRNEAECE